MKGPLEGIRVLDLTAALAGPAATQRLGDWGADVIKVEPPGQGEFTRVRSIANGWLDGETTVYLSLNRNKRSLTLDLKTEAGREQLLELAAGADVFVHNFRPGVSERLGVDGPTMLAHNPRLVYGSVSGYGTEGTDSRRPGQDLLLQAYGGVMFSVGSNRDRPLPSPIFVADILASHHLAAAVLAALIERDRTGQGQEVAISMLGAMLDAQLQELVTYLNLGVGPVRTEAPLAHNMLNPPYGVYETTDGWIAIAMADPDVLGEAIGSAAVTAIGSWEEATKHRELIFDEVAAAMQTMTTAEWLERLDAAGVWASRVHTYADLKENVQVVANGYIREIPHPAGGTFLCPDGAAKFSAHPDPERAAPPALGQHNAEISEHGWEGRDA